MGGVNCGRFSPDGRLLAVGDLLGRVIVYSTSTWKPVTGTLGTGEQNAASFAPDGSMLATDTGAYIWDIRPASLMRHACEVAGRRLTRAEWSAFLPGRAYHPAC